MKLRIAMWAAAGLLVAVFWAIYFANVSRDVPIQLVVSTLARLSCPLALIGDYFHFGVKLTWVLLSNAVFYSLFGVIVEGLRSRYSHAK